MNADKAELNSKYKKAVDKGYGGKSGYDRLLEDALDQKKMALLALTFGVIPGGAGFILSALDWMDFAIYRKKDCAAKNRGTLEACQCVCDDETYTECYDSPALAKIDTIMSPILSFFPILTLGAYASQDEYVGCDAPCTCLSYRQQDVLGNELCDCVCDPPDLPYGNGPCEYERDFDSDTCCCTCPAGSDLAEGSTKGAYARLSDNLGSPAPSAYHESYSTGCNYICDGREADSSNMISPWPPVCPYGYVWNADPTVCNCVDICSTGVCVWVVTAYGCGNINDCTDEEGNAVDDCEYNQTYFTSEEFATEEEANAWVDANGHINTVVNMVLQGTTTASGDINTCP